MKKAQAESQEEIACKFTQLEAEVMTSAAQRVCKCMDKVRVSAQMKKKRTQKAVYVIEEVKDYIETASRLLLKMKRADKKEAGDIS